MRYKLGLGLFCMFFLIKGMNVFGDMHYMQTGNGMHYMPGSVIHNSGETEEQRSERMRRQALVDHAQANRRKMERDKEERREELERRISNERHELRVIESEGGKFDRHKRNMALNVEKVKRADQTNDLIERRRVREEVIRKTTTDEKFASNFEARVKRWNRRYIYDPGYCYKIGNDHKWGVANCHKEVKKYREFKALLKNDLIAINADLKKKFVEIEQDMSTNDTKIKIADETHNLKERIHIRNNVIEKSANSASYVERYMDEFCNWKINLFQNKKCDVKKYWKVAKRYRDYEYKVEKQLPAIEEDFKKQIDPNYKPRKVKVAHKKGRAKQYTSKIGKQLAKNMKVYNTYGFLLKSAEDEQEILRELRNVKAMCNGLIASEVSIFDNLFDMLARKEVIEKENIALSENEEVEKEYIVNLYSYRDEAKQVFIEARELIQVVDNDLNLDLALDTSLNLSGIHIEETEGKEITFTLTGDNRNLVINSDLTSIENYLDKTRSEEKFNFHDNDKKYSQAIDLESLSLWGLEDREEDIEKLLPKIMEFISIIGGTSNITELVNIEEEKKEQEVQIVRAGLVFRVLTDRVVQLTSKLETNETMRENQRVKVQELEVNNLINHHHDRN